MPDNNTNDPADLTSDWAELSKWFEPGDRAALERVIAYLRHAADKSANTPTKRIRSRLAALGYAATAGMLERGVLPQFPKP